MPNQNERLDHRLRRLERRLATSTRIQRGLVVLLLLQLGLGAGGSDPVVPDVLRTRALQVIDAKGEPVVLIASDRHGNGGLAVYDNRSRPLISLEADQRGAGAINVMDPEQPTVAAAFLGVDPYGDGLAGVRSARNRGGASFGIGVHGAGEFALFNASGRRVGVMGGDAQGAGLLRLCDPAQSPSVHLGRTEDAGGVVTVFDETGRARVLGSD